MSLKEKIRLRRALRFARKKHKGQYRAGGEEYITHPVAVCEYVSRWGYGSEYQLTALFHDLLEDTDATEQEILRLGGENVLCAVKLLTKTEGYVMEEYISAIKQNDIARIVKTADRLHNLRSATVTNDEFKRRYIKESREWFCDLSPEIEAAVHELEKTLNKTV